MTRSSVPRRKKKASALLPEASATEERVEVPERLEFVIDKDGRMYINDQQLVDSDPATVRAALENMAGEDRSLPVMMGLAYTNL